MTNCFKIFLSCLFVLCCCHRSASQNNCGVKASFTPGNDSVTSVPFNVQFANTSINAESVIWYVNGGWTSDQQTLGFGFNQPGSYEIKLVAKNGACTDTAYAYILQTGTQPANRDNFKAFYGLPAIQDNATCLAAAKNGGYLLGGQSAYKKSLYGSYFTGGLLINTAESGCIKWTQLLEVGLGESKIIKSASLADEGFIVAAYQDYSPFLMKLNKNGNLLWAKQYHFGNIPFTPQIITETQNAELLVAGIWSEIMVVMKLDASGNTLWSKSYRFDSDYPYSTHYLPVTLLEKNNEVYLSGEAVALRNVNTNVSNDIRGFLMRRWPQR